MLPEEVKHWSLTTLRDRLVKIGARIVRHGRSIAFQMAEVMVPRGLFRQILAGDCREFRVWLVMMGKKELSHASPQSAAYS